MATLGFSKTLIALASSGGSIGGVSVSGGTSVGSVLTATLSGIEATGYQWTRDGVNISGATSATYTLVSADLGKAVTVKVSGISVKGSTFQIPAAGAFPFASMVAMGDSFTDNVGASVAANGYINLLSLALTGAAPLNQAVSGSVLQNSPDSGGSARPNNGRNLFASAMLGANKRASGSIALGYNDARYTGNPSGFNVTQYENDYREILNGLIEAGDYTPASLLVIAPYYITDAAFSIGSAGFTGQNRAGFEAFVTAAANVARDYGTRYFDAYAYTRDAYLGGAAILFTDGYHYSDIGHATIAAGAVGATVTNTNAKPTVSASSGTLSIGYTLTAPSAGTVTNYTVEYGLVGSYVYGNAATVTSLTGNTFTVAAGSYRVRARANYSDGTKSPYVFSGIAVAAAAGDTTAPGFVSAVIPSGSPNKIVLTYNEALSATVTGTPTGLGGKAFVSATVVGSTVEITVDSNYVSTDVVTVTTPSGFVRDVASNVAAALATQAVTNNVPPVGGGGTPTATTFSATNANWITVASERYSSNIGTTTFDAVAEVTGSVTVGTEAWVDIQYVNNTDAGGIIVLDNTSGTTPFTSNTNRQYLAQLVNAGTVLQSINGAATTTALTPAFAFSTPTSASRMRLHLATTGIVTIDTTTDNGTTWTTRHTFATVATGTLYFKLYSSLNRDIYQPRQLGVA